MACATIAATLAEGGAAEAGGAALAGTVAGDAFLPGALAGDAFLPGLAGGGLAGMGEGVLAGGGLADLGAGIGAADGAGMLGPMADGAGGFGGIASGMSADQFAAFAANGGQAASPWASMAELGTGALKYGGPMLSGISGVMGLQQQAALRRQSQLADPWGLSGGRAQAGGQLQALMANPQVAAQNDPGYQLRMQGAQRASAGMGQDSGAMSVAGANASTSWYNDRLAQLGSLAGTGNAQVGLAGAQAANTLMGQSLGSFGFGVQQATGGGMTPQQQQQLLMLMLNKGGLPNG